MRTSSLYTHLYFGEPVQLSASTRLYNTMTDGRSNCNQQREEEEFHSRISTVRPINKNHINSGEKNVIVVENTQPGGKIFWETAACVCVCVCCSHFDQLNQIGVIPSPPLSQRANLKRPRLLHPFPPFFSFSAQSITTTHEGN